MKNRLSNLYDLPMILDDDGKPIPRPYTHCTFRRDYPQVSSPQHDINWWRVPEPRQSLLYKLLHLFKR